jgi:hypothetical protein
MIRISSRDAVKDTQEYWGKMHSKDFNKYWGKLKRNKKKKKTKASSNVPNPLRTNYDYSNELCGPEWQARVKCYMKKILEKVKGKQNEKAS